MTPEREAQMRDQFEAEVRDLLALDRWPDSGEYIFTETKWAFRGFLACARALEPMVRDGERMRWLLDGNGFFMEEQGLCGYAPCSDEEKNAARDEIDAAMSAALEGKENDAE